MGEKYWQDRLSAIYAGAVLAPLVGDVMARGPFFSVRVVDDFGNLAGWAAMEVNQ